MKFSYTALSKSNKQLNGLLEAIDLDNAKEELHKMGLSIVTIQEIAEADYQNELLKQKATKESQGIKTFSFQATDNRGKPIDGTIEAPAIENACERLIREYQFTLHALYPQAASEEEKKFFAEHFKDLISQCEVSIKKNTLPEESSEEEEKTVDQQMIAEIDRVILKTKEALNEYSDFFSTDHQLEIKNSLAELERVRQSNNLKHIEQLCHTIYGLILAPDKLETAPAETRERFQQALNVLGQNTLIKKNAALTQKKWQLNNIKQLSQSLFDSISRFKKSYFNFDKEGSPPGTPTVNIRFLDRVKRYWRERKSAKKAFPQLQESIQKVDWELRKKGAYILEEADSFIGWLLIFYLIYLFLAAFSLEKAIGLPREFVFRTLKTPLIINIVIFLFFSHFIFYLQKYLPEKQFLGKFLIIFFGYVFYFFLIFNL
ncbi:hypothetical protein HZA43_03405 [Candidatus Peregrinibacteria bacterium]|nr:hypothetical protein [Candidatus Peregrinibacteria bacterium]